MIEDCKIKKIIKREGDVVPYNRKRISTAILKAMIATGNPNEKLAESMALRVEQALCTTYEPDSIPSVEEIQDVVENILMENRLTRVARRYIIYRHQHAMERAARAYEFEVSDNVPYRKIYEVLRWNMDHQCDSVPALNSLIRSGRFPDLVAETEKRYSSETAQAAARILEDLENIRIVIVAGPSSSGKTTSTIKISEQLQNAGTSFKAINIDHYFFPLEHHPKDEFDDYDYETPGALDLELINKHLQMLLNGQTIKTPHYDFKKGTRIPDVHELNLANNEILLIDSLHGLYDRMTDSIPAKNKFKLYVETLGQLRGTDGSFLRWSDNRLLRRMIRDRDHRNLQPIQTLTHWHYVRRSELRHIIPFIRSSDFIINTALQYELPILKNRLLRYITPAISKFKDDPRRLDAHIRVNRIYDFIKPLRSVRDDSCIPSDSLLREFIGGSRYRY